MINNSFKKNTLNRIIVKYISTKKTLREKNLIKNSFYKRYFN